MATAVQSLAAGEHEGGGGDTWSSRAPAISRPCITTLAHRPGTNPALIPPSVRCWKHRLAGRLPPPAFAPLHLRDQKFPADSVLSTPCAPLFLFVRALPTPRILASVPFPQPRAMLTPKHDAPPPGAQLPHVDELDRAAY